MRNCNCSSPELVGEIRDHEKFLFGHPTRKEFDDAIQSLSQRIDINSAAIDAINKRLAEYEGDETLEILSFTATPEKAEKGKLENIILSWNIKGKPDQLILNGVPVTGSETSRSIIADTDFVLTAINKSGSVSKTASVKFVNFIYYGTTNNAEMTRATVKSLEHSVFSENLNMEIDINTDSNYIVFAYPKRLGKAVFRSGGFDGGFMEPAIVSVDNHSAYYEDYYVYRSVQKLVGRPVIYVRRAD